MSKIWKQEFNLEALNKMGENAMPGNLGIEFTEIGEDFLIAKMPVDYRTVQPFRILHGGASVSLAETLGSVAATMCIEDLSKQTAVGLEINANHLKSAREGQGNVFGKTTPIRIGRNVQVWNIEISNEAGQLVCVSRLTVAVINR